MRVNFNGVVVDEADAAISVFDQGFLYGDGCYETIGVWRGRLIDLDPHLERLRVSARYLRIPLPVDLPEIRRRVIAIAAVNEVDRFESAAVRIMLTRGIGSGVLSASALAGPATLVIFARSSSANRRLEDAAPMSVPVLSAVTSTFVRASPLSLDPRIKSLNYQTSVLAGIEARERGAEVALLRDAGGYLSEGNVSNVFAVRGGRVQVPELGNGLAGVTRQSVIEALRAEGIPVDEMRMTTYDLIAAEEVFVTASSMNICAIGSVDSVSIDAPGPVTRAAAIATANRMRSLGTPIV